MKISKMPDGYIFQPCDDVSVFFTDFTPDDCGVELWFKEALVSIVYFEQASEFYKAWREMIVMGES